MFNETLLQKAAPTDPVLLAPGRTAITYAALIAQAGRIQASLRRRGFRQEDRIAVVLPNGPELAAAFLCISGAAAVAPLNPAYSTEEFRFYMGDLGASAVVTIPAFCPAAEDAARSLE